MIDIIQNESIFESDCEAWVNPVNCVGVMGAGLAKAFKQKFPYYFSNYKEKCMTDRIETGLIDIYNNGCNHPRFLISFPTKKHWNNASKLEYIEKGIISLKEILKSKRIKSVAIPALGCGLGGLKWEDVLPLIESLDSDDIKIEVYTP